MTNLSNRTLASFGPDVDVPTYDRGRVRPGIVHFGVGNFHRVHQAIAIDACLHHPAHENWGICGVGLMDGAAADGKADAYRRQDNLYTVTELTPDAPRRARVVGAMVEYLHAPRDPEAVLARLADAATRIVSLTITEGGYNLDEASGEFRLDTPEIREELTGGAPRTVFGYIVAALRRRRDAGLPPFTVMSCDNLPRNGDTTRHCVVSFAKIVDPALADWIEANGAFPNSMVDRIAPQVPESERLRLVAATGVDDLVAATCETYTSWVVEDRFCAGRPRLELAGVVFSDEVPAYVAVKGRLSNAAHMLMCYPALLMGARFVDEGMRFPEIVRLLKNFWTLDARPLVEPPSGYSVDAFTESVLARFANPAIKDQLLRVAGDGASKIVVFHGKTIAQLIAGDGDLTREAFLIALFGRYLGGVDDRGERFDVFEPHIGTADWTRLREGDPLAVLDIDAFRGLGLRGSPRFVAAYRDMSERLAAQGVAATLTQILVQE
ncbi:mannitol dehydrogenase family protein [Paraburkholderia susongensis]|uniref:Mannitol 2-dehydrogenase/sorbose reductase n=1 Tax=Paraburkholderia susongensis TaxID=1515439 RepID=A0A1X7M549_9BURK|nr:mannitol dehydrogenase family protein [Paraburkholderia susongensis]SMG60519.1 mannitol 2-dehydrogenase/sorbose reductase [Paraburkholderia susongensis]